MSVHLSVCVCSKGSLLAVFGENVPFTDMAAAMSHQGAQIRPGLLKEMNSIFSRELKQQQQQPQQPQQSQQSQQSGTKPKAKRKKRARARRRRVKEETKSGPSDLGARERQVQLQAVRERNLATGDLEPGDGDCGLREMSQLEAAAEYTPPAESLDTSETAPNADAVATTSDSTSFWAWTQGPTQDEFPLALDEDVEAALKSGKTLRLSDTLMREHPACELYSPLGMFLLYFTLEWFKNRVLNLEKRANDPEHGTKYSANYKWDLNKIMRHQGLTLLQTILPQRAFWLWFHSGTIIPGILQFPGLSGFINKNE